MLLAPPADGGSAALRFPGRPTPSPRVDDHLVQPEITRDEIIRGERMEAQPALAPHGDQHFKLDYVIGAHLEPGYVGSTDLLTRLLPGSDFATDTCVRREGVDPETGQRYLEELAFEIVFEQSPRDITLRAEDLAARGVRRIIAVHVKTGDVEEWREGAWRALDPHGALHDPCLSRPLAMQALLDAAVADDEVVRALEAKGNLALLAIKEESERRGERLGEARGAQAMASALLALLAARGIAVAPAVRAQIEATLDLDALRRWIERAAAASAEEMAEVVRGAG
jgi:hypothetical protein